MDTFCGQIEQLKPRSCLLISIYIASALCLAAQFSPAALSSSLGAPRIFSQCLQEVALHFLVFLLHSKFEDLVNKLEKKIASVDLLLLKRTRRHK